VVTLDARLGAGAQPLFVDFVNTLHWYEGVPIELIGSDTDLVTWLAERALPIDSLTGALTAVHQLRDHARGATEALANGGMPSEADMAALVAALAKPSGHLTLEVGDAAAPRLSLATEAAGADLLALRVALSFVTFLDYGDRRRLKLCANPGCGFAFLDTSTNATRRWCDMRYCGNRLKARAFRSRGRHVASASIAGAIRSLDG
jgi:predicted RNA-binding Zn ribbon-like protein